MNNNMSHTPQPSLTRYRQRVAFCLCRCWFRVSSMQRGLQRGGDGPTAALQSLISQWLYRTVAGAGVDGLCVYVSLTAVVKELFRWREVVVLPPQCLICLCFLQHDTCPVCRKSLSGQNTATDPPELAGMNFSTNSSSSSSSNSPSNENAASNAWTSAQTTHLGTSQRDADETRRPRRGRTRVSFQAFSRGELCQTLGSADAVKFLKRELGRVTEEVLEQTGLL